MGLTVHTSGQTRVNAHRAEQVHAVLPAGPGAEQAGDTRVTALCGRQVQVVGTGTFDSDMRAPGGGCPVCAGEHRRSRGHV